MSYNNDNINYQNIGSNPFLRQNSQDIYNEGKIPDESFHFQGFFQNDPKQINNVSLNDGLNNHKKNIESPKKTKSISKINHIEKNIKKKPKDLQKKSFFKFLLIYFF